MSDKHFRVVFTGRLAPGMDSATAVTNMVLDLGISQQKAEILVRSDRTVLKRVAVLQDAQKMVAKLERAGLVCAIEDSTATGDSTASEGGESILVSMFAKLKSPF